MKKEKVIYYADPMFSIGIDNIEDEFKKILEPSLKREGLHFDNVKMVEDPPWNEKFDILFFDWGGMSLGNDMLGHQCRYILNQASDRPNTYYVMVSAFTSSAMKDAVENFGQDKPFNIFLSISDFATFYKEMKQESNL